MLNDLKFFDYVVSFRLISYDETIDVDYLRTTLIIKESTCLPGRYNLIAETFNMNYILITINDKSFLIDLLKEIRCKASELTGEYSNGIKELRIKDVVNKLSKIEKWIDKQIVVVS